MTSNISDGDGVGSGSESRKRARRSQTPPAQRNTVLQPALASVLAPVSTPVTAPVSTPVTAPVSAPVSAPAEGDVQARGGAGATDMDLTFHPPSGTFELIVRDGLLLFIPVFDQPPCDSQEQEIGTGVTFFIMYRKIKGIDLHGMDITTDAVVNIIQMFSVDALTSFEFTEAFGDATSGARLLSQVSTRFTLLRILQLAQCRITDLSPISALKSLEFLHICIVYDPLVTKWDVFDALPELQKLTLESSPFQQDVNDFVNHGAHSLICAMDNTFSSSFRELAFDRFEEVGPGVMKALFEAEKVLGIGIVSFCSNVPFERMATEYYISQASATTSSLSPFQGLQSHYESGHLLLPTTLRQVFICQCQQDTLEGILHEVAELTETQFDALNVRVHIGSCGGDCAGFCS